MTEIDRERFPAWRELREKSYRDVDAELHDREMDLILAAPSATCFLGLSSSGEAVAMLDLTLRGSVDGRPGSPVGSFEGIYIRPAWRGENRGRKLVGFAGQWCRSQGCRDRAADAELANTGAQTFLARAGVEETHRVVEYKKSLD